MEAIRQRYYFFAAVAGIGLLLSVFLLACGLLTPEIQTQMLLFITIVTILTSSIMAGLWIREYRKLKTGELIVENRILHIRAAVISEGVCPVANPEDANGLDIFISYFGILLDSKIIKFNQEGTRLKAVEIGRDSISLTYGTDKQVHKTRILRAAIDKRELDGIIEKFRYETGIVPVITD